MVICLWRMPYSIRQPRLGWLDEGIKQRSRAGIYKSFLPGMGGNRRAKRPRKRSDEHIVIEQFNGSVV